MVDSKIINALTSIGLTRYEAEVYATLVELGEATAREIADKSTVPREKVYYVLRRLSKHGLAKMISKNPIKYVAMPPKTTLSEKIARIKNQLKSIEEAVTALDEKYNSGRVKVKRRNLNFWEITLKPDEELLGFLEGSNQRLDAILTVEETIRLEETWYYVLKRLSKRGVEIYLYAPLKEINVKSLGRLSNVGEVRIIDEILDYSLYISDEEAGFLISNDLKMGIHFIDRRFCELMLRLVNNVGRHSFNLESILNLIGYEKDIYSLMSRLNKHNFLKMMIKSFEDVLIEFNGSEIASKLLENCLKTICGEDTLSIPVYNIIDRITSIASLLDNFSVEVSFDDETRTLVYEMEDSLEKDISNLIEKGITSPPNFWVLLIQKALELKGYDEIATIVIYDRRLGKWIFQKKLEKKKEILVPIS